MTTHPDRLESWELENIGRALDDYGDTEAAIILRLLQEIDTLRRERDGWQRLAEARGRVIDLVKRRLREARQERQDAVAVARSLVDRSFSDDLHMADIIEKYVYRGLRQFLTPQKERGE